jgi:DNA-binding MarR family transcriptional regulator
MAMTAISLNTLRNLVGRDRSPSAFIVYFFLWSKKGGLMSHQAIADATGLSKSAVQAAIRLLNRRKLIRTVHASRTATPRHFIVKR